MEKLRYSPGDTVRGNCTAPAGNPPANVTWTVNGLPVGSLYKSFIKYYLFYKLLSHLTIQEAWIGLLMTQKKNRYSVV